MNVNVTAIVNTRARSAPIRSPDDSKVKQKMLFASSKDALRRSLVGIAAEIQGTDFSEVAHESGTSPRAFDVLRSVLNGAPFVCVSAVPVLPCSDRQCSTRSREEATERRTRPSRPRPRSRLSLPPPTRSRLPVTAPRTLCLLTRLGTQNLLAGGGCNHSNSKRTIFPELKKRSVW